MNAKPFLDTNVLIYAFTSGDPRAGRAEDLLVAGGTISVQVLNEFVSVSRRKHGRSWGETQNALDVLHTLLALPLPLTMETHRAAIAIARRYRFEIFDATIVATALQAGCTTLYTEDLQHGQKIEGLTIRNPFSA